MPGSKFKLLPGIIVLNRKKAICQFWSNRAKSVGVSPRKWRSIAKVAFDDDPESKMLEAVANKETYIHKKQISE